MARRARAPTERATPSRSRLPVRDDRERLTKRQLEELKPGVPFALPAVAEAARPGTLRRQILLSRRARRSCAWPPGLDFLLDYPYGCTEQQLSRARAYVAFRSSAPCSARRAARRTWTAR